MREYQNSIHRNSGEADEISYRKGKSLVVQKVILLSDRVH